MFMKKYLIRILNWIFLLIAGGSVGGYLCYRLSEMTVDNKMNELEKYQLYFDVLNKWLRLKNCGHSLQEYFEERGYKKIAIYGLGELGQRFLEEMSYSNIDVIYTIDQNINCKFATYDLSLFDKHKLSDVDTMVITPVYLAGELTTFLEKRVTCPIVSLIEIIEAV